ncbi:NF-kappa-B essential modulator isoform X2 [Corythoichthys intestinalis]|uniref:NF-kappa-B essential modulator isoform X2 n=1 Tax=Corythoichthys intestinalis TaxID=161448 RepID=UPI0025A67D46|nr:NF-kappa-B essential modulator isoform X2 [Corythoichthys intestinalis]
MVQPQPDGALQWDMSGDDSGGALRVPPELAANEVVTRLLGDNQQLRDALRRSNHALRQRCEEMEGWQRKTREDREFLSCRFQEARALVERLAQENHSLQGLVNGPASSSSYCSSSSQTEGPFPTKNGPLDATQIPDKQEKKKVEEADQHTQTTPPRSLGDASIYSSVNSPLPTPSSSLTEVSGGSIGRENGQLVEGAIDVLQVKSHKEKLEEGMRELKRKNEELEKQRDEGEKERERMRRCIDQLWAKLSQAQASNATEEAGQHRTEAQHSSDCSSLAKLTEQLQATQGRYRELEEKLDYLQKSSAQRDRTEALLKQKDKDCEALKAQATSLLAELNERQSCLDKSEQERKIMEDKLCSKAKALQVAEQDLEQQRNQHHVNKDKLMLQIQSLEQALKTERHVVTVEKKKLTQLQHAYTCLFRDYDAILKSEGGDLCSRLEEAERALALKQDLIDKLKEEVEQQKGSLETVPVLTAQAEIYKADFLAEREAREKLNQKKEELQDQLTHALAEIDRQKQEAASRVRMEQMKLRHQDDFPARVPHITPPQGGFSAGTFNTAPPPSIYRNPGMVQAGDQGAVGVEDLPDLCCPKCQYHAPDMDTLQIHVMDCIQ